MHPLIEIEELKSIIIELIKKNKYKEDVYMQPLAYFGDGPPGFLASGNRLGDMSITAKPIDSLLTSNNMLNVNVSSWRRISDDVMPPRIKTIANYQNSRYVAEEARLNNYDQSLILNTQGKVAESTYTCVFMVKDGKLITPNVTSGILDSITRKSIIQLSKDELGLEVEEREIDRTEFYVADESFLCGTGGEIQFIGEIDGYNISDNPGKISKEIQSLYHNIVRGIDLRYTHWRTKTYQ
jgi:branched-chain amino acid aminotransferase